MNRNPERIVLTYQGECDICTMIPMLGARCRADVITMTLDLGRGQALEPVRDRALLAGALRAHVLDVRDEFAADFMLPALKADVSSEDGSMVAALVQMITAKKLVEIAGIERATAVALDLGATVDDQAKLEAAIRTLDPALKIVALCEAETTQAHRAVHTPEAATEHPGEPAIVEVAFERGVPVAINGVNMPLLDLIGSLATITGAKGTWPMVPLLAAHHGLRTLVVDGDLDRFSDVVSRQYADLLADGLWFAPLRQALDGFVDRVQQRVTGVVRLESFKAGCRIVGRQSTGALDSSPHEEAVVGDS